MASPELERLNVVGASSTHLPVNNSNNDCNIIVRSANMLK